MGIYIDNIKMPKDRPICIVIDAVGQARRYDLNNDRYADDKLFEAFQIPPHGRCIDVDAMEDNNITYYAIPVLTNVTDAAIQEAELVVRLKDIDAAPTIIPANPTEEE